MAECYRENYSTTNRPVVIRGVTKIRVVGLQIVSYSVKYSVKSIEVLNSNMEIT